MAIFWFYWKSVQNRFCLSTNISNFNQSWDRSIQKRFLIGWNVCRIFEFPSYCLYKPYKRTIIKKLELLVLSKDLRRYLACENSNYWRENLLEVIRQNIAGCWQQTLHQKFVHNTQQCFAFTTKVNLPANNLNFHWRWWGS